MKPIRVVPPKTALFIHEAGLAFVLLVRGPAAREWRPVLEKEKDDVTVRQALVARREMLTGRYVCVTYGGVPTDFKLCRVWGYVSDGKEPR